MGLFLQHRRRLRRLTILLVLWWFLLGLPGPAGRRSSSVRAFAAPGPSRVLRVGLPRWRPSHAASDYVRRATSHGHSLMLQSCCRGVALRHAPWPKSAVSLPQGRGQRSAVRSRGPSFLSSDLILRVVRMSAMMRTRTERFPAVCRFLCWVL